ncbi:MAG: Mitochondrial processing peptidase-like protein [Micavibrio sp.]|nr:Mitochondrial processing peptidase-like protein [Micavibrio sp.]
MTIQVTTLENGLRVVTDTVNTVDSVAIGIWAGVGTRDEDMAVNGVAHMVEHMMFKGTKTRDAGRISEEIEDVGGSINAYTSREITAYHIHVLKEHAGLALEVLADLIQNSTLPDDEVERERKVILQEIGMSNDTPDDLVFDHYQETAYPKQALGAPILGTPDIISGMTRDSLTSYVRTFYTPSRLVISAAGNIRHDDLVKMARAQFQNLPENQDIHQPSASYIGGDHRLEKDLEQAHVVLGFRSISRHDPRYFDAIALSTILGGGMSSRLFQEVREKRGLVYSVFSFHSSYADDGQFVLYAGTGPDRLQELMPVLVDEIHKVVQSPVKDNELARAKTQMRSNLLMARESMMTRAGQQAKHLINFKETLDVEKLLQEIDGVNIASIQSLAADIFSSAPTIAALGPLKQLDSYDKIAKRLAS